MQTWIKKFIWLAMIAALSVGQAFAEPIVEIKKIKKKKRVVFLKVDSVDDFEKGKRVCFFKSVKKSVPIGKKKKKKSKKKLEKRVACGTIVKVNPEKGEVRVRVGKKKIKRIKKNMMARLKGSGAGMDLEYEHGLKFYWLPHVASPVAYNRLLYTIPAASEAAKENLWVQSSSSSQGLVAGGFEYALMSLGLGIGVRFRIDEAWYSEADFDRADKTQYVVHEQSGQAVGGWLNYYILNGSFKLGLGIDYEATTATLKTVWTNDAKTFETPVYEITSPLSVVSLRIPIQYDIYVAPVGLSFGIHGLVPLSVSGSPTVTVNDANGSNTSIYAGSDVEADVLESLAHKQSSFGLDIVLGVFFGF